MRYDSYRFIFPPRPDTAVPLSELCMYDTDEYWKGQFMAEPKFNGDNGEVYFTKIEFIPMNRYGERLTKYNLKPNELRNLFPNDNWNCINGEYMGKSQKDESGDVFNHKFVIFDILILDGEYLLGTTFEERWLMLYNRFKDKFIGENEYSYQITKNVWLVKVWYEGFENIWNCITPIDMIEGLVIKKRKAKLLPGTVEKNNHLGMFKTRKPTKNYSY
jgi:hypothetical protein